LLLKTGVKFFGTGFWRQNHNFYGKVMTAKKVHSIISNKDQHCVGNGFPVRTLFSYPHLGALLSPFLLLDYAGPTVFTPTEKQHGVGEHPHRGFETVTLVYSGEVAHRDSAGGGGKIGPGDVQWMTAGSGVVHEEFHGDNFRQQGGVLEMVQLWVNLPKKDKLTKPRYQSIQSKQIPVVLLPKDSGQVRVIAGNYDNTSGPAQTFSPMNIWDLRLKANNKFNFELAESDTTVLVVLSGSARIGEEKTFVNEAEVALFEHSGCELIMESLTDVKALLLSAEPLNEPIVGSGPFVMNTSDEIYQARMDYQTGKMGHLS
jgi:redox-sensitive bicupin YhaK (pirin superfamily)